MTAGRNGWRSLPGGWVWAALAEVARINYRDPSVRDLPDDLPVTFVPMAAVETKTGTIQEPGMRPLGRVRKGYTPFSEGDVLFAKITPCMENGKAAIARGLANGRGFGSTEFHVLKPEPGVLPEWLFYFVRQHRFRMEAKASFAGTAGQLRVPVRFLRHYGVPIAPTSEQQRIVAKIEALFTQLDAGVAALEKAKVQLQRYRQAVLKAAMEGELTKEWRAAHRDETEPASVLLERILEERRAKWEAEQLAKMKAKGKVPKDEKWKEKYKEPPAPETGGLPDLPEGWVWTKVGIVYDIIGGGTPSTKVEDYWTGDIPWVTSADMHGVKDIRPRRGITQQAIRHSATNLVPAGSIVVVTRVGLGKLALTDYPLCFSQDSQALVGNNHLVIPPYALHYLSQAVQIFKYRHRGTTIAGVTKKRLSELPFALAPVAEQSKIVEEIERRLSVGGEMQAAVEQSIKRAERLRQSILKRAFEGKVVPQDPTDEPASVLLQRIKAEKAKRETEKKTRKKKPRKDTPQQLELI